MPEERQPWTFAAVCVMVIALTLLVVGLTRVPVAELLPGYVATYLLIGACIFGPVGKLQPLRQAVAFLLPGALLVGAGLLDLGFWAGGWLLGLPAWGMLLSRWTPESPLPAVQLLKFLGLLLLGMALFTFNTIWVIFSLTVFLLPAVPLIRLARRSYKDGQLQAAMEVLLAVAAVVVAVSVPTPAGSWSSPWMHAGGAATAGLMMVFWAGLPRRSRRLKLNDGAIV